MSSVAMRERLRPLTILLVALVFAWMPHATSLPLWISPLLLLALAIRFYLGWSGRKLPSKWLLLGPTVILAIWSIWTFRPFFGGPGSLVLLTTMAVLKLFEMRTMRDRAIVVLLGYVIVATRFLYAQTIFTALWMISLAAVFTFVLIEYADNTAKRSPKVNARMTGVLFLQAIPVVIALFIVFPRPGSPLFFISGGSKAATGLSEELSPGSIADLTQSDEVAFRVEFPEGAPEGAHYYWRGPVFDLFDGKKWYASGEDTYFTQNRYTSLDRSVPQRITMEPNSQLWVFALDYPFAAPGAGIPSTDFTIRAKEKIKTRLEYQAFSYLDTTSGPLDEAAQVRMLAIPDETSRRVLALAEELKTGAATDSEMVARGLKYFRDEGFVYTLKPGSYERDLVDQFLFEGKAGFCGHFAASFATLMRAAGVPARVVTGYLGADANPWGGYWIVLQQHAHAWSEVWLEGRGWTRIDPTAEVSPERLSQGIDTDASLAGDEIFFSADGYFSGFKGRWRFGVETVSRFWEKWIVGYNKARQLELLRKFGAGPMGRLVLLGVTGFIGLLWLILIIVGMARREKKKHDPVEVLWFAFLRKVEKRGIVKGISEGPLAFGARIGGERPDVAKRVKGISLLYTRCRYGRPPPKDDVDMLRKLIRELRIPKKMS